MNKVNQLKRIQAIYKRVSCRAFQDKQVPQHILKEIITAGTRAPASGNMQPWEFLIIDDLDMKDKLCSCTFSGFYSKGAKNQSWVKKAPIIIVPCVNYKRTVARYGDLAYKWAVIDTASAVQNMLLAATELGIGSCWVGGIIEAKVRKLLQLPSYVEPLGLIPMGYPAEKTEQKHKIDPKWLTHHNIYNAPYFD